LIVLVLLTLFSSAIKAKFEQEPLLDSVLGRKLLLAVQGNFCVLRSKEQQLC
jgi:hypothetical protein